MNSGYIASQGESGTEQANTTRTLTISQFNALHEPVPDGLSYLDDAVVSNVRLVGRVNSSNARQSGLSLRLDDGTGTCEVTVWAQRDSDAPPPEEPENGEYVEVWGRVRVFNDKRGLTVRKMTRSIPYDRVLYHELTAIREYLNFSGKLPFGQAAATTNGSQSSSQLNKLPAGDSSSMKDMILAVLQSDEGKNGLNPDYLQRRLGIDLETVNGYLNHLDSDAMVFSDGELWFASTS